jgi:hypothetical protein
MSTGALTQLAAVGSQDQYLSVQGEVTFWKGVYRRHTNFAKETVKMEFNQTPHLGQKCTCTISRTGDLLSKVWLAVTLPPLNETKVKTDGSPAPSDNLIVSDQPTTSFGGSYSTTGQQKLYSGSSTQHYNRFEGARYCDEVGHALIKKIDLVIGGTTIDTQYGHFMQVFNELTQTPEKKEIARLIGRSGSDAELQEWAKTTQHLFIPLQFFFCRHLVQSLPLIALQYHEVKVDVEFAKMEEIVADTGLKRIWAHSMLETHKLDNIKKLNLWAEGDAELYVIDPDILSEDKQKRSIQEVQQYMNEHTEKFNAHLLCNLVYLEEEERRTFAGSVHEYLVDLLQFQGDVEVTGQQTQYQAYFNHPTSELIWTIVPNASLQAAEPFNYSALDASYNYQGDTIKKAKLQFNGYDRFQEQPASYFRELVPSQYHTSVPTRPIYVYSFALEPEDFRPSGSVNLSRVDNVKLIVDHCDFTTTKTEVPLPKKKITAAEMGDGSHYIVGVNAKGEFYAGQSALSLGVLTDTYRPSDFAPVPDDHSNLNKDNSVHLSEGTAIQSSTLMVPGMKMFQGYPIFKVPPGQGVDGYYYSGLVSVAVPKGTSAKHKPTSAVTFTDTPASSQLTNTQLSTTLYDPDQTPIIPEGLLDAETQTMGTSITLLFKDIPEFSDPLIKSTKHTNESIKAGFGIRGIHYEERAGVVHPNRPYDGVVGAKLRVYARSKNVLRIKSGMAGLAYAN